MSTAGEIREIPLYQIVEPADDRASEAEVAAFQLALRAAGGMLHPIVVRPVEGNRYEPVTGLLRLAAARAEGYATVPVLVRALSDQEARIVSLLEDHARKQVPQLVQGWKIEEALEATGWSQADLARITEPLGGWGEGAISELRTIGRKYTPAMVNAAAGDVGVPASELEGLPRGPLRALKNIEDRAAREAALRRVATALRDGDPVLSAIQGELPQVDSTREWGDGAVQLDIEAIQKLPTLALLRAVTGLFWCVLSARVEASPVFAWLREAKKTAGEKGGGPDHGNVKHNSSEQETT